jgi:hypothetical protein
LTNEWAGYMGVSLKLNDDKTFDYWFYSDAKTGDEPKYPLKGKWESKDGILALDAAFHLYDNRYIPMKINGKICLFPKQSYDIWIANPEKEPDYSRIHFHNTKFDSNKPHDGRSSYNAALKPTQQDEVQKSD